MISGTVMNGLMGSRVCTIALWVNVRLKYRNSSVSVSFLAPNASVSAIISKRNTVRLLPFGIGRKPMTTRAFLCALLIWFWILPIER